MLGYKGITMISTEGRGESFGFSFIEKRHWCLPVKLYVKSDILDALWGYARMRCQCTVAVMNIRADRKALPFPEGVAACIVCKDDKRGFDDTFGLQSRYSTL